MFKHLSVLLLFTVLFFAVSVSAQTVIYDVELEAFTKMIEGRVSPEKAELAKIVYSRTYVGEKYYLHAANTAFTRTDTSTWYIDKPISLKPNDGDTTIALTKTHPYITNPNLQRYPQSYDNLIMSIGFYKDTANSLIYFPFDIGIPHYFISYEIRDIAGKALGYIRLPADYFAPYKPELYDEYYKLTFTKYKEYKNVTAYKLMFGREPYENDMFPGLHKTQHTGYHDVDFYSKNKNVVQDILIWFDKDNELTNGIFGASSFKGTGIIKDEIKDINYYERLKDLLIEIVDEETTLYNDMIDAGYYFEVDEEIANICLLIDLYGDEVEKLTKKRFDDIIAKQEDVKYWDKIKSKIVNNMYFLLPDITYRTTSRTVVLEDGTTMVVDPPNMKNKYPQTEEELKEYIEWGAIKGGEVSEYGALYDWYGTPYKWEMFEGGITLSSAGKDKEFDTKDDIVLTKKLDPEQDEMYLNMQKKSDTTNRILALSRPLSFYGTKEQYIVPPPEIEGDFPKNEEELQLFLDWKLEVLPKMEPRYTVSFGNIEILKDYFGTELKFEITEEESKITSAGLDMEFGTKDDIIFRVKIGDLRYGELLDLDGNVIRKLYFRNLYA